jgi:DNA helicase-2/ATP-dependent DNA helicase PcrA
VVRDPLHLLNEQQREAVLHRDGPLLVLAGAGSGKTRVIAHRVAHLLASGQAGPREIIAVTFTNKAAAEMRERIGSLVGADLEHLQVRTFHSLCLRILRREAAALGFPTSFVIYDDADQQSLIRDLLRSHPGAKETWSPKQIASRISSAKNMGVSPAEYAETNHSSSGTLLAAVYQEYQSRLRTAHAMDFDDLILKTLELFRDHTAIAGRYADRCRHLLVDEYQDTNRPQHLLVRNLTRQWGNVCVVGDEDQSIYSFRGADIGNILKFEEDYPGTRIIKLERNYRSTRKILEAASSVVANNSERLGKTLWTEGDAGEGLDWFRAPSEWEEAVWVVQRIREWQRHHPKDETAILYRTNSQSRPLEEALNREAIPYRIVGGIRFYERKEVKDLLSYLRLLIDPEDDVGFDRILNVPARDIGPAARMGLEEVRQRHQLPLTAALRRCLEEKSLPDRSLRALGKFQALLEGLRADYRSAHLAEALSNIIDRTGYIEHLHSAYPEAEAEDRIQNVDELLSAVSEFDGIEDGLGLFLDQTSLIGETDVQVGTGRVVLMTIHSAKGLEFPTVLLVGLEEGMLPHGRSLDSSNGIEEERRLFYVGITRAGRRVAFTHAATRRVRGVPERRQPSRFLAEIPHHLLLDRSVPAREIFASREDPTTPFDQETETGGSPFSLGQRVHHPTLGVGTIIGIEGSGENLKLTISFPGSRAKKILPRYTRLRPVSPGTP